MGCGKKRSPLKFFVVFLATVWNFNKKILQLYSLQPFTSNCQVKFDSIKERQSYRLFNMTAYWFFSIENV